MGNYTLHGGYGKEKHVTCDKLQDSPREWTVKSPGRKFRENEDMLSNQPTNSTNIDRKWLAHMFLTTKCPLIQRWHLALGRVATVNERLQSKKGHRQAAVLRGGVGWERGLSGNESPPQKRKNLPILTLTSNFQLSSDGKQKCTWFLLNLCDVQHAKMVFYLSNAGVK